MTTARLDLTQAGWLAGLLDAYLDVHDPADTARLVSAVRAEHAGEGPESLALRLVERRLGRLAARPPALPPRLAERLAELTPASALAQAAGLAAVWDVLMAVAALQGNRSAPRERKLELLAVLALGLEELPLARRLHEAHLRLGEGEVGIEAPAAEIERRLEARERERLPLAGHPLGAALSALEARALAAIGSLYFERATIEEEGIARLHELTRAQRVSLIQALTAMAWADGKVTDEERRLIEHHVKLSGLPSKTSRQLRTRLDRADPAAPDLRGLEPLAPSARRFVLEQVMLLALVDDELDEAEERLLEQVGERLGASELELEAIMVEVTAFYEKNRDAIRDFGPVSGAFGRLRALVMARAHDAVLKNTRRIVQEIKETGELAKLLGAASLRELSSEEAAKVKSQLLDICKTIPALAIFVLPGGGLLLPVLLKVLPFNLLPTAFNERDDAPG